MELGDYLKTPELAKCVRQVRAGDYIFKQGQKGTTLFIILTGEVELLAEREDTEHIEGILTAGHFLGEKAVLQVASAHQRLFSARARSNVQALELSHQDIDELSVKAPTVVADMLKRSFQIAGDRLARANFLIRVLRSSNNDERLVNCIRFFCRTAGRKTKDGIEVSLSLEALYYYIDMEPAAIATGLERLVQAKLVHSKGNNLYVVPDENALMQFIIELRDAA